MTDLHDAAESDDLNKCRKLIEQGADVNAEDECGRTPLHFAADEGISRGLNVGPMSMPKIMMDTRRCM